MIDSPRTPLVHLVGPGGAGKTTAGRLAAQALGWQFVDLDECFMAESGGIAECIDTHGYRHYAASNVALYRRLRAAVSAPVVMALSSGFMTYAPDIADDYPALCASIEADPLTSLLMPAWTLDACVACIVQRQLARPYLRGDVVRETQRIRERFAPYMALRCARILSDGPPDAVAARIVRLAGLRARQRSAVA